MIWSTLILLPWNTHLTFKIVLRFGWNDNIYETLSLAHSKLLFKIVACVIVSMNNTIIFIWPIVEKELEGKDQAWCQDFLLSTTEQLYLQKNQLAAAHNFDELGSSAWKIKRIKQWLKLFGKLGYRIIQGLSLSNLTTLNHKFRFPSVRMYLPQKSPFMWTLRFGSLACIKT